MLNIQYLSFIVSPLIFCSYIHAMEQKPKPQLRRWSSQKITIDRAFLDECKQRGTNPNLLENKQKQTALIVVCKSGQQETLKLLEIKKLIDLGDIDPNAQDILGNTALHYASMNGNQVVVKTLLELENIDPTIKNNEHKNPWHIAVQNENKSIVNLLSDAIEAFTISRKK